MDAWRIRELTVRFMKLRNFLSISVKMEKSPLGRFSLTVVTFIWRGKGNGGRDRYKREEVNMEGKGKE
jgi:hypothetical protein